MSENFRRLVDEIKTGIVDLQEGVPQVMQAFGALGRAAYQDGALPAKTKEMLSVAIAIATGCDGCIAWHVRSAVRQGLTRPELQELIGVALHMGGGPALSCAARTLAAFDQFAAEERK